MADHSDADYSVGIMAPGCEADASPMCANCEHGPYDPARCECDGQECECPGFEAEPADMREEWRETIGRMNEHEDPQDGFVPYYPD